MDHAGIVYYPVFYHYFHVAFEELFRERLGARAYVKLLDEDRIGFPAVHSECDYKAPLRFADSAETQISLERLGTKSVTLRYRVSRIDEQTRDRAAEGLVSQAEGLVSQAEGLITCAEGLVTCAVTDLQAFRAIETPPGLRDLFLELRESVG